MLGLLQGQLGPVELLPQAGIQWRRRARTRCRVLTTSAPISSAASWATAYSAAARRARA
ncbi:hypothetical protein L1856_07500 [Streptomyces sp. Tue 6430]|nr:hypothetical protein [Streptomyces sp. Tue 6430]